MRKILIIAGVLIAAIAAYFMFTGEKAMEEILLETKPEKGEFIQTVFASGELKAKKSTSIRAPAGMQAADIYQTTIKDIITEGTFVRQGQYIGSLDRTEIANKLSDINSQIETEMTKLEQTKIDTAISMKEIRDQIADIEFNINNEKLEMERNKYEPTMVIEQSKINLEKSERTLRQLRNKQELLHVQSVAKVEEVDGIIKQLQNKLKVLNDLSGKFSIKAPEAGMLIYQREWNGNKKGVGSQISSWNPVVAELPDLSTMISVAYVNEVDISKIKEGQLVDIKVDAFPEKKFTGMIINVANIGQELRNQDAKVFEITIEINEEDEVLKPSMTTSNEIKIYRYEDVVSVPLDAYYSDSLDYVLVKSTENKVEKREVVSGPFNEDRIVILAGIVEDDKVLLSRTEREDITLVTLPPNEKGQAKAVLEKWQNEKESYDKSNLEAIKGAADDLTQENQAGGGMVIISG